VQLLAVTPGCHWLEYVDWADPILERPVSIKDGKAIGAPGAGLGMKWKDKAVKKYAL
jgi:mandelate racemase